MGRSVPVLVMLAVSAFPIRATQGSESDFIALFHPVTISHSVNEGFELHVAINPPRNFEEPAIVTYRFVLQGGNPLVANVVEAEGSIVNIASIAGRVEPITAEEAYVIVNDQQLCCVAIENGRVAYRLGVHRSDTAMFLAGGEFPIPVADRATVLVTIFDLASHKTVSSIYLVNGVKLQGVIN